MMIHTKNNIINSIKTIKKNNNYKIITPKNINNQPINNNAYLKYKNTIKNFKQSTFMIDMVTKIQSIIEKVYQEIINIQI